MKNQTKSNASVFKLILKQVPKDTFRRGNIFNAERDNKDKGVSLKNLLKQF